VSKLVIDKLDENTEEPLSTSSVQKTVSSNVPEEDALELALWQLRHLTKRLRLISNGVIGITLLHIAYSLFSMVYVIIAADVSRYSDYQTARPFLIFFEVTILGASLITLLIYDRIIAEGEALYQEISDELEWYISRQSRKKRLVKSRPSLSQTASVGSKTANGARSRPLDDLRFSKDRPGFSVRLLLREFVLSARLPFIRGNQGVIYYVAINVILTLAFIITVALKGSGKSP
jgi:hypothetical protein